MLEQETNLKTSGFTRFCFHFSFTYPNVSVLLSLERERGLFFVFVFFICFFLNSLFDQLSSVHDRIYLLICKCKKKVKP